MDTRWLARIDSHIAAGRVAAAAESAELLSWLLKLEPEQRWCLVLNRDRRLERLLAADYRRLLALMVENEADAVATAPQPPRPCIDPLPLLPAPPDAVPSRMRSAQRPGRLAPWLVLACVLTLGLWWLFGRSGLHPLAAFERHARQPFAAIDDRGTGELRMAERLRRLMLTRGALEALEQRFAAGEPFATELTALENIWPQPERLTPLRALAETGNPTAEQLRASLARLHQGLGARHAALMQEARGGRLGRDAYFARLNTLSTLHARGGQALDAARQDNWDGALRALAAVSDPDYRAWRTEVTAWLEARALVGSLAPALLKSLDLQPRPGEGDAP